MWFYRHILFHTIDFHVAEMVQKCDWVLVFVFERMFYSGYVRMQFRFTFPLFLNILSI
jgi:hypothetical protein